MGPQGVFQWNSIKFNNAFRILNFQRGTETTIYIYCILKTYLLRFGTVKSQVQFRHLSHSGSHRVAWDHCAILYKLGWVDFYVKIMSCSSKINFLVLFLGLENQFSCASLTTYSTTHNQPSVL